MKITEKRTEKLKGKIQASRSRMMLSNPLFALLLMRMRFVATDEIKTISTDGKTIYFSTDYIGKLNDTELDFILCHQIMHIIFDDINVYSSKYGDKYHHYCDIENNLKLMDCGYTENKYPHIGEVIPSMPRGLSIIARRKYKRFIMDTTHFWGYNGELTDNMVVILESEYNRRRKQVGEKKEADKRKKGNGGDNNNGEESIDDIIVGILNMLKKGKRYGKCSLLAERDLGNMKKAQMDWRKVILKFLSNANSDYSFLPPDRRFDDFDFFLPALNTDENLDVLFAIDTSGSMSDEEVTNAYSEVKGAIEQFGGTLKGWLAFFDTEMSEPISFMNEEDLKKIRPVGGGGTSFHAIFDYVNKNMKNKLPSYIIILTDGGAEFPKEADAEGVPVLWVVNNEEIKPPWGRVARIK